MNNAQPYLDARWYSERYKADEDGKGQRFAPIAMVVDKLWQEQSYRRDAHLVHMRLYGNAPILGLGPRSYARKRVGPGSRQVLAFNVVKSCTDAYTAKITKERPKVTFVTSGGDYDLRCRAEQLDKFTEGQFYETDLYELAPLVVLDSAVIGNGVVKVFTYDTDKGERIKIERVMPWEILVDDEEAIYGDDSVRTIYQIRYIDRLVLCEMFPEKRLEIAAIANHSDDSTEWGYTPTADHIKVIEAWHLKSGPDANDGLHVICTGSMDLHEEAYDKPYLPFVPLRRQRPQVGWWGMGLAEELTGIQLEMNVLLQKIQRSHHLLAAAHWLVQKGSLNKNKLDNDLGSIIEYSGVAPTAYTPPAVSGEVYAHLDRLYQKAYEITGISQLSAQGQIPRGFDPKSGRALRVYSDIENERFQVSFHQYQHWYLTIAKHIIDLAKDIAERNNGYSVKAASKNLLSQIKWDDVKLEEDEYVLKLYPTSALANDPAQRMATVQEWMNAGLIDRDDGLRLLDMPDLEAFSSLRNANFDVVQSIIEGILKEGEYRGPEPFMDLENSKKWVQMAYLKAWKERVADDRLELLRRWMTDAQDMMSTAANDNAVAPPGMPVNGPANMLPATMPGPVPPGPSGPPTPPGNDNGNGGAPPMPPM